MTWADELFEKVYSVRKRDLEPVWIFRDDFVSAVLEKNGEIETPNVKYIGSKVDVTIAKASAFQDLVLKAREVKK